ncbi:hypothetical protein [Streptomyces sp. NPDC005953]|uniref:hypothetical protein n=1 Tax=Streptomyces sp. NPDC005953 TaxID=3156719 RepID=UPI0033F716BF
MGILVEVGWGGLIQAPDTITWTDVTTRVDQLTGVTITRGASDELSETQPGTATLRLDNEDGALTPGNTSSPWWPYVRRNAPIRIAATHLLARTGTAPWPLAQLTDDFDDAVVSPVLWPDSYGGVTQVDGKARVPLVPGGSSGFQSARQWILDESQFAIKVAKLPARLGSSSARILIAAHSTVDGRRIGFSYSAVDGLLRCRTDTGGTDAGSTNITYDPIMHMWLRIRDTAGTTYWETSPDGYAWTVRRSLASPAWVGTDQVYVEITGSRTGGSSDPAEFDLAGALVFPRFYGTLNELPVTWEGLLSTVTVSATDLFKRLNRLPSLKSCLVEEILQSTPMVYYPLTEQAGSVSAGDLSGTSAGVLTVAQVGVGGTLDFGSTTGPAAATDSLPVFTPVSTSVGKHLSGDLGPVYQDASTNGWNHMEGWFQTSTPGRVIFAVRGPADSMEIVWSLNGSGALQAETTQDGTGLTTSAIASGNLADGGWHHFAYDEYDQSVHVDGVLKASDPIQIMVGLRLLLIGARQNTRLWSGSIGHIALHTNPMSVSVGPTLAEHWTAGTTAFSGETADDRLARLARYVGLDTLTVYGSTHDPVTGQGDGGTGVVPRMREVETSESGKLFAARDWYGLDYQSRDVRYNPDPASDAFTIPYADLETGGVQLADDDQKLCNSVEATRPGGATQKVVAAASIAAYGTYGKQLSLLKTSDNSVLDAAYWIVSRYADPDPELREVPVEAYTLPAYTDILAADISSHFTVIDLPPEAPATELRVLVEGYTETLKEQSHRIQFRTSASTTDSVWVIEDPVYGLLDQTTRLAY